MDDTIRVLVVDNEPAFCADMSAYLGAKGFTVETAASGAQALERVQACGGDFDVAVVDQVMGPPNGTEIMQEIRRLYPAIEVLILTAWGNMEPGQRAMELGAYRYMSKPVVAEELAFNIRTAARLGREQQRRQALEALVRAGHRIGTAQSEDKLYEVLHEEAGKLLPGLSAFLVSSVDEQTGVVSFPYARRNAERLTIPARREHRGIAEFVQKQGRPVLLPFGDEAFRRERDLDPPHTELGYCSSEIAAPMFLAGRVVGAINALSFEPGVHYTQEQAEVFQAFANQAAVEIRNVVQRSEAEELRKASEALTREHGRDAVLRAIVREANLLIGSDFTGMILREADGSLRKVRPVIPEDFFERFEEPRQQGGVTRWVVENREPRIVPDTHDDALVKDGVRQAGIRSMLAFPLAYGDRVLGVLYAHTFEHHYFVQHDVDLWRTFATQAAAVLWAAMEEEREVEDTKHLAEALGSLAARVDLEETMRRVANAVKLLLKADTCRLFSVDPPTRRIMSSTFADGDPVEYRIEDEPRAGGTTFHVLETLQPIFRSSPGAGEGPSAVPKLLDLGLRSFATAPLVHGRRAIAVAQCAYLTRQEPFDERTRTLLEALAGRAALALDGARRDRLDEIWNHLDRAVAECTELARLYELFADHARRALYADFSVFYPYDPTAAPGRSGLKEEESVCVGELWQPWEHPRGGHGGGVHKEIEQKPDGLLIVNDLNAQGGRLESRLAGREGIRAFVGLRLDVRSAGQAAPRIAGMLFLNYRQPTAFEPSDLVDLRRAGILVASSIRRLNLRLQRFRQLRAVVEILEAFRARQYGSVILRRIAQATRDALGVDTCTVHEYEQETGTFPWRGAAGLEAREEGWSVPEEYKTYFLDKREPTVIEDAPQDKRMEASGFVAREGIQSAVVYPLYVDDEPMGLLFASFRYRKAPTQDELATISLFANIAALVLHEARLREQLSKMQRRLDRRLFLDWVSMIETTWRHAICRKAAAIRNHAGALQMRLDRCPELPSLMAGVSDTIADIDDLAAEIAAAPPRVPQSWEMEAEFVPLGPLLDEVADREGRLAPLRPGPTIQIRTESSSLAGVQVLGYRRWLIYTLEALLQNARGAMAEEGAVLLSGQRAGDWAEVRVRDTGSGVPVAIRSALFKQLVPKEADETGMGIGALLAAIIVEEHGGTISLERPGPGDTTVLLRLPVAKVVLP